MIKTRSVNTPPGTQPQPTRRSTKSRRAGYSAELVERASARRKSKKERAAKARQRQAAMVVAFGAPATNAPANPPVGAPVRTPVRKPRKSRAA